MLLKSEAKNYTDEQWRCVRLWDYELSVNTLCLLIVSLLRYFEQNIGRKCTDLF